MLFLLRVLIIVGIHNSSRGAFARAQVLETNMVLPHYDIEEILCRPDRTSLLLQVLLLYYNALPPAIIASVQPII